MTRLTNLFALLRTRIWIVPALMSAAGLWLAYMLLGPVRGSNLLGGVGAWWVFGGDASSARNLLSALLSGMMTMTSLVVSITFVTLTLAANQLGPRLINNFIADRAIQAVIGLFLSTIIYMIVVLRTVGNDQGGESVPHIAVTTASVLTIACIFALLFYVHKVSRAIIADNVIERVFEELRSAVASTFPDTPAVPARSNTAAPARRWISMDRAGYVQTIDYDALVRLAERLDAVFQVNIKAGDFVLRDGRHIGIAGDHEIPDECAQALRGAVAIGSERSPAQDLNYSIRQLVELALRALSPGVNDPFTAVAAIDRLAAAMELILKRPPIPTDMPDPSNRIRVVALRSDARSLADSCFDQIREAATQSPAVLIHLVDTLIKLAASCRSDAALDLISTHLGRITETVRTLQQRSALDRALLARLEEARRIIETGSLPSRPRLADFS